MTETAVNTMPENATPPWRFHHALAVILIVYGVVPLLGVSLVQLALPLADAGFRFVLSQALPLAATVVALWLMGRAFGVAMPAHLGMAWTGSPTHLLRYTALGVGGVLATTVAVTLLTQTGGVVREDPLAGLPRAQLEMVTYFAVVSAPLLEELLFRGLMQGTLARYFDAPGQVLATMGLFVLFHPLYWSHASAMIYVVALALLLGVLRVRAGSIYPGVLTHLFNNALAATSLLYPHWLP